MTRLLRWILALYPESFTKRVGESMEQTIDDVDRNAGSIEKLSMLAEIGIGVVVENLRELEKKIMSRSVITPALAAIVGVILVMPGVALFTLLNLGIEPPLGPLRQYVEAPPDTPNVVGSLIALTVIVFLPLTALIINYSVFRRTTVEEGSWLSRNGNLLVAVSSLAIVVAFITRIAIDQYPCWIGVPNCD